MTKKKKFTKGHGQAARHVQRSVQPKTNPSSQVWTSPTTIHPARMVLKLGKARLYGGGFKCAETGKWDLIIDLNTGSWGGSGEPLEFLNGADKLIDPEKLKVPATPTLKIDWPDGSAPEKLDREFWISLVQQLATVNGDVLIHCHGGHGRTGTALAAIVGLMYDAGYPQPHDLTCVVEWVRTTYNLEAIETREQLAYLVHAFNLPISEKAIDDTLIPQPYFDDNNGWSDGK